MASRRRGLPRGVGGAKPAGVQSRRALGPLERLPPPTARQLPAHIGQVVDDHGYDAVEALAARHLDHPPVAVLLTADHPGWSAIDGPAWTVESAAAAGVEPSTLELTVRAELATQKALSRSGVGPSPWTGGLAATEALDQAANQSTPDGPSARELRTAGGLAQRARSAERARQVQAFGAAREAEREAARAEKGGPQAGAGSGSCGTCGPSSER